MNPAFLLGTAFNIAYWHRKYHSGTICKGVSNPQTSNAFTGCDKEEIPKCVCKRKKCITMVKASGGSSRSWSFKKHFGNQGILVSRITIHVTALFFSHYLSRISRSGIS